MAGTLMALGYRIRVWFTRRGAGPVQLFAPPARRPAPGQTIPAPSAPVTVRISRRPRMLLWVAAGIVTYLAGIAVLLALGWVDSSTGTSGWTAHTLTSAGFALAIFCLLRIAAGGVAEPSSSLREHLGCALVGIGLVWFVLGIVDMHVLGLFHLDPGSADVPADHAHAHTHSTMPAHHSTTMWDWGFHGIGPVFVVLGWSALPVLPRFAEKHPSAGSPVAPIPAFSKG
ncbi:hypothetical protein [Nocardia sp. NPDC019395]|uniref:hypothetical protein n=1 Tax=Nocardia sp. NPDC019395 TaxID=3154686 RepID=UPI00340FC963